MILNDFFRAGPQLSSNKEHGREPSLFWIIMHYYTSHDVPRLEAAKMTNRYIGEMLKDN